MSDLALVVRRASEDLRALAVPFALVGGLAVSLRCEPRFTRDADLAVAVSGDEQAESLLFSMRARGYEVGALVEQVATDRLATARLRPSFAPDLFVDLLMASSGIEDEVTLDADTLEVFPGTRLPVASCGDLIALKVLSFDDDSRPQDTVDVRSLMAVASDSDLARAQQSVRLITERGYARGRPLANLLAAFVRRFRG